MSLQARGRILELTADQYHRGEGAAAPYLTQSTAARLINQSPLHAYTYHPMLGGKRREPTKDMDEGTLLHTMLLGKGKRFEVIDANDFRTAAAREARDNAIFNGAVPVLKKNYNSMVMALEEMRRSLSTAGVDFSAGQSEMAFEWYEQGKHGEVLCRAMMDSVVLRPETLTAGIFDLKKCVSAHPRLCGKHMVDYGYDIQSAAYPRAIEAAFPDLVGRVSMRFAFIEVDEPYAVCALPLSGQLRDLGLAKWKRAVLLWEECLLTGKWPGYPTEGRLEPLPYQMEGLVGEA
jgi:PDDEXK-like uncharacterized protein DUF3799